MVNEPLTAGEAASAGTATDDRACPGIVPVDDPDDPRLDPFRAVRDRDVAGRGGFFVAEGEVVVRILLSPASRFRPAALLLSEGRARASPELAAAARVPVYVADRAVMDRIVGFPIHRGILAIGRREANSGRPLLPLAGRAGLALGLVGLANHDNVGGAFRNAAAFGADAVLLDGGSCDPLYRKAIRVSVGAALTVPFRRGGTAEEMVERFVEAGFAVAALTPSGAECVDAVAWPARTALLVGSEGAGLPPELLGRLRTVRIAMAPGFDSLNVATAAGIALHAVMRSRAARPERGRPGD